MADSSYSTLRNALEDGLEYVTGLPAWLTPGVLLTMRVALGLDGDQVRPVEVVRAHPERTFLFIHCDVDQMVPLHQATELRAAANASSELWVAAGCQHAWAYNDHPAEWESRVLAFLDKQISR